MARASPSHPYSRVGCIFRRVYNPSSHSQCQQAWPLFGLCVNRLQRCQCVWGATASAVT